MGRTLFGSANTRLGFVEQDDIVIPTSLPELVKHLEIFVGSIIATVMLGLGVFS